MQIQQGLEAPLQVQLPKANLRTIVAPRNAIFAVLVATSAAALVAPLRYLVTLCLAGEEYSYILLIPVMLFSLFVFERKKIFQHLNYSWRTGSLVILAGLSVAALATLLPSQGGADVRLSVEILGLTAIWMGAFVLCFGADASRGGIFALLFGLLLVPLPRILMAAPIHLIQHGSAEVTDVLFTISGAPIFRSGMTFSLARLSFVVATECSGIHSMVALFIASILAGHFCIRPAWKKIVLVALVIPIISFTNGLRMFIIAMLANYVDVNFFYGNLHHNGGSLFLALALAILALVIKLLGGRLRFESHLQATTRHC